MQSEKKEVGGWWMWVLFLIVISIVVLGVLKYFGMIGSTVVERVIFENSFQYSEGMKQRGSVLESALAEVDLMVVKGELSVQEAEAQKRVLRVQLGSVK